MSGASAAVAGFRGGACGLDAPGLITPLYEAFFKVFPEESLFSTRFPSFLCAAFDSTIIWIPRDLAFLSRAATATAQQ